MGQVPGRIVERVGCCAADQPVPTNDSQPSCSVPESPECGFDPFPKVTFARRVFEAYDPSGARRDARYSYVAPTLTEDERREAAKCVTELQAGLALAEIMLFNGEDEEVKLCREDWVLTVAGQQYRMATMTDVQVKEGFFGPLSPASVHVTFVVQPSEDRRLILSHSSIIVAYKFGLVCKAASWKAREPRRSRGSASQAPVLQFPQCRSCGHLEAVCKVNNCGCTCICVACAGRFWEGLNTTCPRCEQPVTSIEVPAGSRTTRSSPQGAVPAPPAEGPVLSEPRAALTGGAESSDGQNGNCLCCMDARANIVFQPCNHLISCSACALRMSECPLCRQPASTKLKIFLP